jgi:hypothetical protein
MNIIEREALSAGLVTEEELNLWQQKLQEHSSLRQLACWWPDVKRNQPVVSILATTTILAIATLCRTSRWYWRRRLR